MTDNEFEKIVSERCDKIVGTLSTKAKEYVRGGDRLHNFNRGATVSGIEGVLTFGLWYWAVKWIDEKETVVTDPSLLKLKK